MDEHEQVIGPEPTPDISTVDAAGVPVARERWLDDAVESPTGTMYVARISGAPIVRPQRFRPSRPLASYVLLVVVVVLIGLTLVGVFQLRNAVHTLTAPAATVVATHTQPPGKPTATPKTKAKK